MLTCNTCQYKIMAAMKVKTDIITMANVYSYNYLFLESETDVF